GEKSVQPRLRLGDELFVGRQMDVVPGSQSKVGLIAAEEDVGLAADIVVDVDVLRLVAERKELIASFAFGCAVAERRREVERRQHIAWIADDDDQLVTGEIWPVASHAKRIVETAKRAVEIPARANDEWLRLGGIEEVAVQVERGEADQVG